MPLRSLFGNLDDTIGSYRTILLWSRVLLPDGSEFLDGVSDWEALQLEEVLSLMRAKPPIAAWLRLRAPRPGLAR